MIGAAQRLAAVAVASVVLIAFSNVFDVILRNFFSTSFYGLNEINSMLVAIAAATCLPYGLATGAALSITLLSDPLAVGVQAWLGALGSLLAAIFFALLAWRIGSVGVVAQQTAQTMIMTKLSIGPFYIGMAIAIAYAALIQGVVALRQIVENVLRAPRIGALLVVVGGAIIIHVVLAIVGVISPYSYRPSGHHQSDRPGDRCMSGVVDAHSHQSPYRCGSRFVGSGGDGDAVGKRAST